MPQVKTEATSSNSIGIPQLKHLVAMSKISAVAVMREVHSTPFLKVA